MANKVWVGTDSGNEGDWSVAANWSPSGVPVNTDNVIFDGTSNQAVTAGLNQSAVTLTSLFVSDDYSGAIAASGGYLQINSALVRFAGTAAAYIDGTLTTVNVSNTLVDSSYGLFLDGTVTTLRVSKGRVQVQASAALTTLELAGSQNGAVVDIGASVTGLTTIRNGKGTVTSASACTNVEQAGGSTTFSAGAISGEANIYGGTFTYSANATLAFVRVFNGAKADFSANNNLFTVTDAEIYAGTIDRRNGLGGGTWTNGIRRMATTGVSVLDDPGVVLN